MPFGKVTLNDGREVGHSPPAAFSPSNSLLQIPGIAFGTGSVWKRREATPYVAQALRAGFVHIDTAQSYETEESIPSALKQTTISRDKIWITTKYWRDEKYGSLGVRGELLKSLERVS